MTNTFTRTWLVAFVAIALMVGAFSAYADTSTTDFESPDFSVGNINGQQGWSKTGPYDHAVAANVLYPAMGDQSLRISNAVTSSSFGDHTISASLADAAGETGAAADGKSAAPTSDYFHASFDFASAVPGAEQPGMFVNVSPDRGDGARMSYIGIGDGADGLYVGFYDFNRETGTLNVVCGDDEFEYQEVASGLDRSAVHNVEITMEFVDGPSNDVVTVTVDGTETVVGTSWEDYFIDCEGNPTRTVDSLIFLTRGTAHPENAGAGFYFDNINMTTEMPAEPGLAITAPAVDDEVLAAGEYTFMAEYVDYDDTDDNINWALKSGTCDAGTPESNLAGYSVPNSPTLNYDSGTGLIDVTVDMSEYEPGMYCFVVNPIESAGPNFREVRPFWIADISATPEEAYNLVGDDHTVTADIGIDMAGVAVHFDVAGVNSESADVLTDENGEATFTYSSAIAGIDTITACLDLDAEGDCDEGEPTVDVMKYWYEGKVSGGGQILEMPEDGKKKKDEYKVSFGGGIYDLGGDGIVGDWTIQLHNVSNDDFDKTTFHATEFTALNFFDGNATVCDDAMNFTALGTLDGEAGWKVIVRGGDLFGPASQDLDTLRVTVSKGSAVYDTYSSNDFPTSANCVGTARTAIDNGNLKIER